MAHYFGTYAALVREVLRAENDRIEARVRERISADDGVPLAAGIMDVLFDILADERYLRLFVWTEMHMRLPGRRAPGAGGADRHDGGLAFTPPSRAGPCRAGPGSRRSC